MQVVRDTREPAEVMVGIDSVTIKTPGRSSLIVAKILGHTFAADGKPAVIWLDRLVRLDESRLVGWQASGAISTILRRD